jgi:rRNA-processing protein FCF1
MKFLLDANFLMIPGKFKADIFQELEKFGKPELFTIDLVMKELSKLSKGKGKDAFSAKLGIYFIQERDIGILETEGKNADSEMLALAGKGFTVCTQDRALISKIKRKGFRAVFLRQGKYLEIK